MCLILLNAILSYIFLFFKVKKQLKEKSNEGAFMYECYSDSVFVVFKNKNNNQKIKIPTEAFHFSNIAAHLEEKLTSIK